MRQPIRINPQLPNCLFDLVSPFRHPTHSINLELPILEFLFSFHARSPSLGEGYWLFSVSTKTE